MTFEYTVRADRAQCAYAAYIGVDMKAKILIIVIEFGNDGDYFT